MSYEIVEHFPNEIIYETGNTCITLYQPTFRHRPENLQDIIRFKNLTRIIHNYLHKRHTRSEIEQLMKPFNDIASDRGFWNNAKEGLAVLANSDRAVIYRLNTPVKELVTVSDSFHIKPLLRKFQSVDRYHLLGISRRNFVLYEGDRYGFDKIEIDEGIPRTIEEVLGDQYTEPYLNPGAYGGAGGTPMFHGHGSRKEEVEKDTIKYFRYVDRFVLDKFSNVEKIPLMLVALDEHHGLFRGLTNNRYLTDNGIRKNYETLTVEELKSEAWKMIESIHLDKVQQIVDRFELERTKSLAADDLSQIAKAAVEGRIDVLMLEADKIQPGRIDKSTGEIIEDNLRDPEFDYISDDLAQIVLSNKGNVMVLSDNKMPAATGVAAIYRF
ncbi:MAG TPA: hypothetical protein VFC96_07215 [Anaerovoracaceae bacterium]|nr:hypothetical protein [Anaerovoracaceae bacterium]